MDITPTQDPEKQNSAVESNDLPTNCNSTETKQLPNEEKRLETEDFSTKKQSFIESLECSMDNDDAKGIS